MRSSSMIRIERRGSQVRACVGCFALGAGLMYILDPDRGARRRSLIRNKLFRILHETEEELEKAAEDARNRARGIAAETRASISPRQVSDETLRARVRSAIGRATSHPHAIAVSVRDGNVTLSGPILSNEAAHLISTAQRVRGIKSVENRLEPHAHPGSIPGLQGAPRHRRGSILGREYWPPSVRLWAGLTGGSLAVGGFIRRGLLGATTSLLGSGLLIRALANLPARRLFGIGAGRRAVDVQKTINIDAPPDVVFAFFANFDNFPHFMSNVREVRAHITGRSHWIVEGPAGATIEWDADLTQFSPNELLAWRSVEGATVDNAGSIRFQENETGGTRVDIKMSYNPPAGALGHAIATLFGAGPKSRMDEDLMRLKNAIETGRPPRDASKPLERQTT